MPAIPARAALSLLPALLLTPPLAAQSPWVVRPDGSAPPAGVRIEAKGAAWQVATGPAAILYRPTDTASEAYTLTARLVLLPGPGAQRESFGLFVGGRNLTAATQRYTYFLLRGDGSWRIKFRRGMDTGDVANNWQTSPVIVPAKATGEAANQVRLEVTRDQVRFLVNGKAVWSGARAGLDLDGLAGVRLNHNLTVRVEGFGISR